MLDTVQIITATGAVLGPAIGAFALVMAARIKAKPNIGASQADLVTALNEQTKTLLTESRLDRHSLKRRVDHQDRRLTRLATEVAECNKKHLECEASQTQLRAEIAEMLRGVPVATYPHGGADAAD